MRLDASKETSLAKVGLGLAEASRMALVKSTIPRASPAQTEELRQRYGVPVLLEEWGVVLPKGCSLNDTISERQAYTPSYGPLNWIAKKRVGHASAEIGDKHVGVRYW